MAQKKNDHSRKARKAAKTAARRSGPYALREGLLTLAENFEEASDLLLNGLTEETLGAFLDSITDLDPLGMSAESFHGHLTDFLNNKDEAARIAYRLTVEEILTESKKQEDRDNG